MNDKSNSSCPIAVCATADILNISQSSLSKNIAALEKELCFPLFDRTRNQLRLNQHGAVFAKYAEQALNTLTFGVNNARSITYAICQKAGFLPKAFYQTDDFVTKIKIVQSRLAVSLIPKSCLEDARLLCPGLRDYELAGQICERTVYLMRHKKAIMSEAALDFWNFALDYFGQPEDERD